MEISKTGYWNAEIAHIHHAHSKPLEKWIIEFLKEKNQEKEKVIDLGCGLGMYLNALYENGFKDVVGFEGDPSPKKIFNNIWKYDITDPIRKIAGNVICLEVMEHIPQVFQERVLLNIDHICKNYLILSWAVEDQPGFGHVNCKNNKDVIYLFEKRGFILQEKDTENARAIIDETTPWFKDTLLIFKRRDVTV